MATFKEWFEGQDEFGYQCDRFAHDLEQYQIGEFTLSDIEDWLERAYNQGYFHAEKQRV